MSNVEQVIIQHKQIVRLHAACAVQIYAIVQNSIVFANPSTVLVHVKYANQKYFLFQTMKWINKIRRKHAQTHATKLYACEWHWPEDYEIIYSSKGSHLCSRRPKYLPRIFENIPTSCSRPSFSRTRRCLSSSGQRNILPDYLIKKIYLNQCRT